MIHKIMTSREFPYFAIPPKVYKKSEAVVGLESEAVSQDRNQESWEQN